MIKFIFTILFIVPLISFSQDINKVDSKGRKQGKWVKKHATKNNTLYKGEFKDGNPVGKFIFYYKTGKVKAVNLYSNKGKDSYAATYYENGKVMSYGKYTNKKKDSVWVYYDEFGNLSSSDSYKNELKNGKDITYYPYNSKIQTGGPRILELIEYQDGMRQGEWIKYYKSGKKIGEGTFDLDQYEGKQTYYHSNGNKKTVMYFKHGVKNGYSIFYDGNGKESFKKYYRKGVELKGEVLKKHLAHKKKQKIKPAKN